METVTLDPGTRATRSAPECPRCDTGLIAAGALWICVNCSFEAPLAVEERQSILPELAEGRGARRSRRRLLTPLGFGPGDPCPRICGEILSESDGAIVCAGCGFRYPEALSAAPVAGRLGADPNRPDLRVDSAVLAPASEERVEPESTVQTLIREMEALKEENRRLVAMIYALMQQRDESAASPAPSDPAAPEPHEGGGESKRRWWRPRSRAPG